MADARRARARSAAVLPLVLLLACHVPVRYRGQLGGNPRAGELETCARECKDSHPRGDDYLSCFARCPGVVETERLYCSDTDRPPQALCEEASRVQTGATALVVVAIIVGVAGLGVLVYASGPQNTH